MITLPSIYERKLLSSWATTRVQYHSLYHPQMEAASSDSHKGRGVFASFQSKKT